MKNKQSILYKSGETQVNILMCCDIRIDNESRERGLILLGFALPNPETARICLQNPLPINVCKISQMETLTLCIRKNMCETSGSSISLIKKEFSLNDKFMECP